MQQSCKKCGEQFTVQEEDKKFYDKFSPIFDGKKFQIPLPEECSNCREQQRMSFRNERNLYHRKCDFSGREIISAYSPDKPYKVYAKDIWWGDKWDPLEYGQDFDFSRPFFEQFAELKLKVPSQALITSKDADENNCPYVNFSGNSKNCHMTFDSDFNQDSYYSNVLKHSVNCIDCSYVRNGELCHECIDCFQCYNLQYSQDCTNCTESYFLNSCIGCSNCFFCTNLVKKEFYINNKPYSKEEYFKIINSIDFGSRTEVDKIKKDFDKFVVNYPRKYARILQSENCTGDYILHSKNCYKCYKVTNGYDLRFCDSLYDANDCMDVSSFGEKIERVYESGTVGINCNNILFSFQNVSNCSDLIYCDETFTTRNCFGCVSLRQNRYCILNKQYSEEEYEKMVARIIEHMQKTGEWGQFFPVFLSTYGYNETIAQEAFPLTKDQAVKEGFKWSDYEMPKPDAKKIIPASEVPDNIKDINDDILDIAIECEVTKRPYKLIIQELNYYKRNGIPVPRKHPDQRHKERMSKMNPRGLWDRKCDKCSKEIKTSYSPQRPEKVYCESCYLKEVV